MEGAYGEHDPVWDESFEWNAHRGNRESVLKISLASANVDIAVYIYLPSVVASLQFNWAFVVELQSCLTFK